MIFDAAAELVRKGDPDRFKATLAAPLDRRGPLMVLYAFNFEVARAPWQTTEPLIAEMRLQFWADTVTAASNGVPPPKHPVAGPLAEMVAARQVAGVDVLALIEARRFDIGKEPHQSDAAFRGYMAATSGGLMWMAAHLLGAGPDDEAAIRRFGTASGVAALLVALPEIAASGRHALPDPGDAALVSLAEWALAELREVRRGRRLLPKPCTAAMLVGWQADAILRRVQKGPAAVREGRLQLSEFHRRRLLAWRALTGRW